MNTEIPTREIVKGEAYVLTDELLARKGIKLGRGHSLHAISYACGFDDWNKLSAFCNQGIGIDAVIVAERHANRLACYLVEKHGMQISVDECAEILRTISHKLSDVLKESA